MVSPPETVDAVPFTDAGLRSASDLEGKDEGGGVSASSVAKASWASGYDVVGSTLAVVER